MATNQNAVLRLFDANLTEVFYQAWDERPEQFSQVFDVKKSNKRQEEFLHIAGTGMWPESSEGGATPYEDVTEGEWLYFRHKKYAKGMQATREAIDDELFDVLEDAAKDIARSGRATVETVAAGVLNDGFTVNGYDGVPLFSNSHPLPKGHTLDNLASGALTDANLKDALILGRKQVDNSGLKIMTQFDNLIVPPDLEFTALTILESALKSGTDYNDKNVLQGRLKVVVLDYLDDDKAWFIQDKSASKLRFYWRVQPEFKRETDFDTHIHKWAGYTRFSVGYAAPQGIVGSPGT